MAKIKVWGWVAINHKRSREHSGMVRTIIAERSQKRAAAIVGSSLHEFRNYWSETGNKIEIETATQQPGVIFQATTSMGHDFAPVRR